MALTERLALLVTLDANGAIKGLESVGKTAARELGKTESKLERVGKKFQKAGVGMLAGAGLAATGLYKAGQAAADLEQAVGGTEAVFKDSSKIIDKYAKGAARNMGLSERAFREATTSIGGQLKALGFEQDEAANKAVELTGVAADLAATYGGTTAEAVSALGAAFRGEADPAERFNLRLNQNTVNAKAVELGLAATTSQVDAQAKAQATLALITEQSSDALGQFGREAGSASGAMAIANAEFEDAKAALGESVAPILADVAGLAADVAGGFSGLNEKTGGLVSKLATFGTIGLGAAGALSFLVGKVLDMKANLGKLGGVLRNTEGGLTKLGKAGAVVGTGLAVAGLVAYEQSLDDLDVKVDELANALGNLDDKNRAQLDTLLTVSEASGQLDDVTSDLADTNVAAAERFVDYAEANGVAADKVAELRDIIKTKQEVEVQATKDAEANAAATKEMADATDGASTSSSDLTDKLAEQEEALDSLLEATLAQFDANLGYRRSVDDVEDSLTDLRETQKEHGRNSEEYRDQLLQTEGALLDQAEAAVRLFEDTAKANGQTLDAKQKTAIYKQELVKLRDQLAAGSPLRAALDGYIATLNKVPDRVATSFTLNFPNDAKITALKATTLLDKRAAGGPVTAGTPYLVGEEGPELFTPKTSGAIIPNDQLVSSSTAGSAGVTAGSTYYVTINTAADPQSVVEALKRFNRTNGDLPIKVRA